ncbi:hypothetical protein QE390_005081 [Siphonobacter sp. SORGH_AS 1065]|nr:hypothetical protein [Siphonobacter sp. SORGH_AS_1065]
MVLFVPGSGVVTYEEFLFMYVLLPKLHVLSGSISFFELLHERVSKATDSLGSNHEDKFDKF